MMRTYGKYARLLVLLLAMLAVLTVCACDGGSVEVDTHAAETETTPDTQQETPTEAVADTDGEADTLAQPAETQTSAQTDASTETSADAPVETVAETDTEALVIPADTPKTNDVITFCDFSANEELFSGKLHTAEVVKDGEKGSVLKLATAASGTKLRNCFFKLDYEGYMETLGMDAIAWGDCAFAVLTLKVENVTGNAIEIIAAGKQWDTTFQVQGTGTYSKDKDGWQTIVIPLPVTDKKSSTLKSIRVNFAKNATAEGETVYIKSIALTSDREKMLSMISDDLVKPMETTLRIPGLKNEYKFLHVTDLHSSAFSSEDTAGMTSARAALVTGRRNAFMSDGIYAEERMPLMFSYADEIKADLLLLSGDILDFPSQKNLALLRENIKNTKTPSFFILGNHDWCYGDDDYFSANAIQNQIPLFNDMTVGEPANDPYFHYVEYEDLIVVAVDNSQDMVTKTTVDKFMALYEKNKPIILMLHVPMHVDSLVADCTKVWGKDLGMGDTGVSAWHPENDVARFL